MASLPVPEFPEFIEPLPVLVQKVNEPGRLLDRVPDVEACHAMYLIDVNRRLFAHCLTCGKNGDDVAIELFDDADLKDLVCPVDLAWRLYRAEAARVFDNTVFKAITGARREAEYLRAMLPKVS